MLQKPRQCWTFVFQIDHPISRGAHRHDVHSSPRFLQSAGTALSQAARTPILAAWDVSHRRGSRTLAKNPDSICSRHLAISSTKPRGGH